MKAEETASMARVVNRAVPLGKVFSAFDLDCSGTVEAQALLVLGMERTDLNLNEHTWTAEKNTALVQHMDANLDGRVEEHEFVRHFCDGLADQDDTCFLGTMVGFMACAVGAQVKARKQEIYRAHLTHTYNGPNLECGLHDFLSQPSSRCLHTGPPYLCL